MPLTPDGRLRVHRIRSGPATGIVIVRPDGYVGFRSGSGTPGAAQWLALVGGVTAALAVTDISGPHPLGCKTGTD
ncbi:MULTISPECIES: hypothetical protein [unclassified Rhodococcus (in: high G+C Gram-positive bacteria)]|uniref:hypothetical protein n=1 Tax=unclassified Rhodococcus (in: high G+C Gram-positive bacteria) TaxID=192944 RepID=UPI001ED92B67|nr:hypothetical protein [Rhodococcus sp. DK17]